MSIHEYWKALTATALLGTERQAMPSAAGTPLAWVEGEGVGKEEALLNAAAAASLYRRSGVVLRQSEHPAVEAAPPDEWKAMTADQHGCFEAIMHPDSRRKDLMGELFDSMVKAKVRPHRDGVFRVIEEAHKNPALQDRALQIMDQRGRWLARFVKIGQWVSPSALGEEAWQEGRIEERLAYLKQVRSSHPAKARELIQSTWAQESHEVRARMLQAFADHLSLEDEPFLESCLDDKRKEVRTVAQELLNRMPESRLVGRMVERAKPFLEFTPAGVLGLKKAKLEVRLPEKFEKDWTRDGIEQKSVPHGMGEKAWWLQQIVERIPPSLWGEPQPLIPSLDKEWREVLLNAWQRAAVRFKDAHWALALLENLSNHGAVALIAALPAGEIEAQTLHRLRSGTGPLEREGLEWQFLQNCPRPLSAEIVEALGQRVMQSLSSWQQMQTIDWAVSQMLHELAMLLPPALLRQIPSSTHQAFSKSEHPFFEEFASFVDVLTFRQQMHQAFGKPGGAA
jgi:hypothetical protein